MRKLVLVGCVLAGLACAGPLHAATRTWFGFVIGVSDADPPAPIAWESDPDYILVNHVAVVRDTRCEDDVFHRRTQWWRLHQGWWYRSTDWRGPWTAVDVRRVPKEVLVLPAKQWRHHPLGGAPGLRAKHRAAEVAMLRARAEGRGRGRED